MSSKSSGMLASIVREIVAPVLREAPQECGIASITDVEVSADVSFATVYVSALQNTNDLLKFLRSEQKHMQHQLHLSMQRRKVPQLRFRIDERIERGNRMDELLKE